MKTRKAIIIEYPKVCLLRLVVSVHAAEERSLGVRICQLIFTKVKIRANPKKIVDMIPAAGSK